MVSLRIMVRGVRVGFGTCCTSVVLLASTVFGQVQDFVSESKIQTSAKLCLIYSRTQSESRALLLGVGRRRVTAVMASPGVLACLAVRLFVKYVHQLESVAIRQT